MDFSHKGPIMRHTGVFLLLACQVGHFGTYIWCSSHFHLRINHSTSDMSGLNPPNNHVWHNLAEAKARLIWYNRATNVTTLICMCYNAASTSMQFEIIPSKQNTVETLYSTIYYSKYFIKLNIDKSTQYVALWTHKRHPIPRPFGRAMECLLWVLQQKLIVL